MAKPKRKTLIMVVTVSVPNWTTAATARRAVKDYLNSPNNWDLEGPDFQEGKLRAVSVRPLKLEV